MEFKSEQFENRKQDHIRLALDRSSQTSECSGFDRVQLHHDSLTDLNLLEVDLSIRSLGTRHSNPFYISGMTAGHSEAGRINLCLAQMAAKKNWAMGLGSQRRDLARASEAGVEGAEIKLQYPDLELFSNLGISQIIETEIDVIQNLVTRSGSSALFIHLNALQEALQPEGTPRFKGGLAKIQELAAALSIPILLKETGSGFSRSSLKKLTHIQVAGIDVSGLGGTHWGRIEGMRAAEGQQSLLDQTAQTFKNWGVSTVESTRLAIETLPSRIEVWSSGGVRTGLDAAKLLALGATRVGFAQPALEAALKGETALHLWAETREYELKVALFCTGSKNIQELQVGEEPKWTIV